MPTAQARNQSLASCGAALIAFIGVCHEAVGDVLFPWGPTFLGGPIGWHGMGLFVIAVGLGLLGGTLRLFRFPVVAVAFLAAAVAMLAAFISGIVTAHFHRKAARAPA